MIQCVLDKHSPDSLAMSCDHHYQVQNQPGSSFVITKLSNLAVDLNFGFSEKKPDSLHPASSSIFWAEHHFQS